MDAEPASSPVAFQRQATPIPRASPTPTPRHGVQENGGDCAGLFGATCTGKRTEKYRGKWKLLCTDCLEKQKVKAKATPAMELDSQPAAPAPAPAPSPPQAVEAPSTKRKRGETAKKLANQKYAVADSQTAVETARKVSARAAQQGKNAEAEAALTANHGDRVARKRTSKRAKATATDADKENIQDA